MGGRPKPAALRARRGCGAAAAARRGAAAARHQRCARPIGAAAGSAGSRARDGGAGGGADSLGRRRGAALSARHARDGAARGVPRCHLPRRHGAASCRGDGRHGRRPAVGGGAERPVLHVLGLQEDVQARDEPHLPHDHPPAAAASGRNDRALLDATRQVPGLQQGVCDKVPGEEALPAPPLPGRQAVCLHQVQQEALRRQGRPHHAHEVVRERLRLQLRHTALLARRAQAALQVLFARAGVARPEARGPAGHGRAKRTNGLEHGLPQ
mmetsp:Transcript_14819/g.25241  ORF Transcript_14819/g.25241 Transcript_14819/m.25241 type:complete len:268 (+) Transcript_14819:274-1077(+)